ncbi:hypothetical protein CGCF415_v008020 [Colletotrichum fructicola]|uniref:Uncharacterized protein n=1 Tax=Colletotrichum fructicola (strain Nara gc5) TaxID=1213859 RepID=L2GB17_COLFN|nr:uncharacterized protein CGMCC3_g7032 [Colletotrichum fructicola]KAF4492965.1 hypothetical protein CGGC5_v001354 [Colletotrichum fructicola Nara gc5]KAE9576734.1 hypothetical protein CGMCC3_g7032 [Colletotrichum fructicola]KAF4413089.1 hypothetical protein CFRS1_v004106 [Colletotrichum fructicola]KAF4889406.1 hypothetical protein CGCFRS4_v009376 [Colletotrichum fructicola]KAF4906454.1 hypothetical protein CGCF415_v008020 [Colletotrichum fructicola]
MATAIESAPYTGPSPRHMIDTHTLAQEIINRDNDPCPILDEDELALLSQFVADPSKAGALLEARGEDPTSSGSLVAYVISLHGTEKVALTNEGITLLKEWFGNGRKA